MENCLRTQLKSVVQNDTLKGLGEIAWEMAAFSSDTPQRLSIYGTGPFSVMIKGSGHFYNSDGSEDKGQTLDAEYTQGIYHLNTIYINNVADGDKFVVANKYNMKSVTFVYAATALLKQGSVLDLTYCLSLETLNLYNKEKVVFSIEDIGKYCANITSISNQYNNLCSGSIEKFVENNLAAGRTSGTCELQLYGSHATLNGVDFFTSYEDRATSLYIAFSNNGATITWKSTTIASYNGTTWSYN